MIILSINFLSCNRNPEEGPIADHKYVYEIPASYWPKINIGGTITSIIVFVTLTFGLVMYIIGHFAGGKLNKSKIFAAIGLSMIVAIFGRSFNIWLRVTLTNALISVIENRLVSATIVDVIVYFCWTAYISGIAVYVYETFVVTAKEAHPM